MKKRLAAIFILSFCLAAPCARAYDSIWSALVVATKEAKPAEPPQAIARFRAKLEGVFGYNQFRVIGQHTEVMDELREHWLVPTKSICMGASVKKVINAPAYFVELQIYQDHNMLAEMRAELGRNSPIFIRGPMYGDGQLIIILLVK